MARTRQRRSNRASAAWLLAMVLIGVLALGLVLVLAGRGMTRRMAAAAELDRAIQISRSADAAVLAIDAAVRSEVGSRTAETIEVARSQVPTTTAALEQAVGIIDGAYAGLNDDEREQATALRDADAARIEMLKAAVPLLDASAQLAEGVPLAQAAYEKLSAAEKRTDAAVRSYNKLDKAGAKSSLELNRRAEKELIEAKRGFQAAQAAVPGAVMSPFVEYADARIEVVRVSIDSDKALLAGKTSKADTYAERFNKAEKRLTVAASRLPKSPTHPLTEAYAAKTKALQAAYFTARDRVSAADKVLREQ